MIKSQRLLLRRYDRGHVAALLEDRALLGHLLGAEIPSGWPQFQEAFTLGNAPSEDSSPLWPGLFFIDEGQRLLVGSGGFKGGPDETGEVEIGYEIAPQLWNRGYATEAVHAMIAYAWEHPEVRFVAAHTLAGKNASNSVLRKVGMTFCGEIQDPDDGAIWKWQVGRVSAPSR